MRVEGKSENRDEIERREMRRYMKEEIEYEKWWKKGMIWGVDRLEEGYEMRWR